MDQAELGIKEVVIEDALLSVSADEFGSLRPVNECEGGTGFQCAKDADESLGDRLVADEIVSPLVLAELASAIEVGAAVFPSPFLSMLDEAIGVLGCQGFHELGAADVQDAIDEVFQFAGSRQGQMTLEDDAVETGEHGDDQACKLGDEARQRLHGVLLRKGLVQTPFWPENAVFSSSYLVAAMPRWE